MVVMDPPVKREVSSFRLTAPRISSIMQVLPPRTISKEALSPLDRQSGQLVGYLDELFQRMMLQRRCEEEPAPEVSREEVRAMIILHSAGKIIMSSLAEALGVPLSTATHTVDRLVAKGLAVRNRSDEDRRVVQVEMSEHGKRLQDAFRVKRGEMARSWLAPLSSGEREIFLELMDKITRLAVPSPEGRLISEGKSK
jgi:DNA-binding MarR family transcriptional regulator